MPVMGPVVTSERITSRNGARKTSASIVLRSVGCVHGGGTCGEENNFPNKQKKKKKLAHTLDVGEKLLEATKGAQQGILQLVLRKRRGWKRDDG